MSCIESTPTRVAEGVLAPINITVMTLYTNELNTNVSGLENENEMNLFGKEV